jgi:phenylacetate-CoA ligase
MGRKASPRSKPRGTTPGLHIPPEVRARTPLITEKGYRLLKSILEHPDAPRWNYVVGDRVVAGDVAHVKKLRAQLAPGARTGGRAVRRRAGPPGHLLEWIEEMRRRSWLIERRLDGIDPARDWERVPTMGREDLAARLAEVVPHDADFDRMIVYDTSGTTGHAIHVPHHPRAVAMNHAFMEHVLRRHGVKLSYGPGRTACVNVGAQRDTVVFATVFSIWDQAGFAKVNFHPSVWDESRARRFLAALDPPLLTGDPVAFAEMMRWGVELQPAALVSTAVSLTPAWRARLSKRFDCPVIDTYATTETGPIAYGAPDGEGMCILPPDTYVEVVDEEGRAAAEGETGEICVTGGRNPYVPLLRYRTGDFARLARPRRRGSGPSPRLFDLQAREPVLYRAADGTPLNPVDVGRLIRTWPIVQHEFLQRADLSCELVMRCGPGLPVDEREVREALCRLFGAVPAVEVRTDDSLGARRKVVPFASLLEP